MLGCLLFSFAQICLIVGIATKLLIGKHFSVSFLLFFSSFWEITYMYAKMLRFLAAFFAIIILCSRRNKRNLLCSLMFFCICYFSKTKRIPPKKYREMFSYHFVVHIPKIRSKNKKRPKIWHKAVNYVGWPFNSIMTVMMLVIIPSQIPLPANCWANFVWNEQSSQQSYWRHSCICHTTDVSAPPSLVDFLDTHTHNNCRKYSQNYWWIPDVKI